MKYKPFSTRKYRLNAWARSWVNKVPELGNFKQLKGYGYKSFKKYLLNNLIHQVCKKDYFNE